MPSYDKNQPDALPQAVRRLPDDARSLWVDTYNAALEELKKDLGAWATAWARIRGQYTISAEGSWERRVAASSAQTDLPADANYAFAVPLEEGALADGAPPVEFLRTGTFYDMFGRRIRISVKNLDKLVANFDSGRAEQKIPIDIDHQMGQAAGWAKSLWRDDNKVLGEIDWNSLGRHLIGDKVYQYLSAMLNREKWILRSISLCNFPAVKDLTPVELSAAMPDFLYLASDPVMEMILQEPPQADISQPVASQGAPQDASPSVDSQAADEGSSILSQDSRQVSGEGAQVMSERMEQENAAPVLEAPANGTPLGTPEAEVTDPTSEELALVRNLRGLGLLQGEGLTSIADAVRVQQEENIQGQMAQMQAEGARIVQREIALMNERNSVSAFASKVMTEGSKVIPGNLVAMKGLLMETPRELRVKWMAVLENIHLHGLTDLTEHGTSMAGRGAPKILDPNILGSLRQFLASYEGATAEEFFESNAAYLGVIEDYDRKAMGI